TFKIRRARFSNGDPVTVDDVVFSLTRLRNANLNTSYTFLGDPIKHVTAVDSRTVRVELTKPTGAFLDYMGIPPASIYSRRVIRAIGDKAFSNAPVGSGSFMVKNWK